MQKWVSWVIQDLSAIAVKMSARLCTLIQGGSLTWLLAGGLTSLQADLFIGLLTCPPDMAAGVQQREG